MAMTIMMSMMMIMMKVVLTRVLRSSEAVCAVTAEEEDNRRVLYGKLQMRRVI